MYSVSGMNTLRSCVLKFKCAKVLAMTRFSSPLGYKRAAQGKRAVSRVWGWKLRNRLQVGPGK